MTSTATKIPAPATESVLFCQWLARWFVPSAGCILALTGLAKAHTSLFSELKLLTVMDPMFGTRIGSLMLLVGLAELAIAYLCLFGKRPLVSGALVAWIGTNFLVYRVGLWWLEWKRPCGCLGNFTDAVGISPATADAITKGLLAYLLVGSYAFLFWQWWKHRQRGVNGSAEAALKSDRTSADANAPSPAK